MTRRRFQDSRSGLAVVEIAVLLPVVLVTVLAAVDYCRIYKDEVIISHAAHIGAVAAASQNFSSDTKSDWEARVRETTLRSTAGLSSRDGNEPQVTVSTVSEPDGYFVVTVDVTHQFQPTLLSHFLSAETTIHRSQTMRRFR